VNPLERLHRRHHGRRRLRVLGEHLVDLLPRDASVLDVGCGDGLLTRFVADRRRDLDVRGTDVLVREGSHVPVEPFDGRTLPWSSDSFDVVVFVDVLHHAEDPFGLLRDAARVARRAIVIKDHTLEGPLAGATLRFMDRVSNRRHGVHLPYEYWTRARWNEALRQLALTVEIWRDQLGLYPWPVRFLFERQLHFAARLQVQQA
jgi:SAM-dependent methyltransferase